MPGVIVLLAVGLVALALGFALGGFIIGRTLGRMQLGYSEVLEAGRANEYMLLIRLLHDRKTDRALQFLLLHLAGSILSLDHLTREVRKGGHFDEKTITAAKALEQIREHSISYPWKCGALDIDEQAKAILNRVGGS